MIDGLHIMRFSQENHPLRSCETERSNESERNIHKGNVVASAIFPLGVVLFVPLAK